ncbi:hypothetical protein [Streptomyces sp. SHP 1-2]|uniref:hypothetical protein n=1 Tax=Streptomyces sp. SHP 1-2 TaxID=2769489 RepID=UPI00223823DB|nr:hypothetical protein [Streptomyces sp. SHP 1-2]MCW5251309.1 hypothetical protein [Streptomyces sp. SHP 1-2]
MDDPFAFCPLSADLPLPAEGPAPGDAWAVPTAPPVPDGAATVEKPADAVAAAPGPLP